MRRASTLLFTLAGVLILAGVAFQVWMQGMACAFSNSGGQGCPWRWPWTMGREDLLLFYGIPFGLASVLIILGVILRRR